MEIIFEFEDSDIIVQFEPDFAVDINFCDIEKVQWNFHSGNHSRTLEDLLDCTPEHEYA